VKYKKDKHGNQLSVLGLGCMRFKDFAETERMILRAIDGGVNFFDTAFVYPNSEETLGEILAKNDRRRDIYISTKLPIGMCNTYEDFDKFFHQQLERLQTDYIDYYFMHNITSFAQWEKMVSLGVERWIAEKKASGEVKQAGFSFHGICSDFLKLLEVYNWDFCMIQYNYYDPQYQAGETGLKAAAAKGIPVFIMEPLLGGRLATGLPEAGVEAFARLNKDKHPAEWAFWWLWNQEEVTMTLSGMNTVEMIEANMRSAMEFRPLTEVELKAFDQVREIFRKGYKFPCTGCNYCLPCPQNINIPACLSAYNTSYAQKYYTGMAMYATTTAMLTKSVRNCNMCGKCEKVCPQNIEIRKALKRVARRMEPAPIRLGFKIGRKLMRRVMVRK